MQSKRILEIGDPVETETSTDSDQGEHGTLQSSSRAKFLVFVVCVGVALAGIALIVFQALTSQPKLAVKSNHTVHAWRDTGAWLPDWDCCGEESAACRACAVGESVEEFCITRAHSGHYSDQVTKECNVFVESCGRCGTDDNSAWCRSCQKVQPINESCGESLQNCVCDQMEEGVDYYGSILYGFGGVENPAACCRRCRDEPACNSWTYYEKKWCNLKRLVQVKRGRQKGMVSGLLGKRQSRFQIRHEEWGFGLCVEVEHGVALLKLVSCDSTASNKNQLFTYEPLDSVIRSSGGLCLEANATVGMRVKLSPCDAGLATQRWDVPANDVIRHMTSGLCFTGPHGDQFERHVLAHPCESADARQKFSMWIVTPIDASFRSLAPPPASRRNLSLYCVALMLPWGGESTLIRMQLVSEWSLFACDAYDVYSNVITDLGGVATRMVYSHLHCPKPEWPLTVANTPVFQHFWNQVISDGRYLAHDWIVKVDPDTVFFAKRLHDIVAQDDLDDNNGNAGILLDTCQRKTGSVLHGPIEVLSRQALNTYSAHRGACEYKPQEDVYLHDCLDQLGVRMVFKYHLLGESHCDGNMRGWSATACEVRRVAYHPFKGVLDYKKCVDVADTKGRWFTDSNGVEPNTV